MRVTARRSDVWRAAENTAAIGRRDSTVPRSVAFSVNFDDFRWWDCFEWILIIHISQPSANASLQEGDGAPGSMGFQWYVAYFGAQAWLIGSQRFTEISWVHSSQYNIYLEIYIIYVSWWYLMRNLRPRSFFVSTFAFVGIIHVTHTFHATLSSSSPIIYWRTRTPRCAAVVRRLDRLKIGTWHK